MTANYLIFERLGGDDGSVFTNNSCRFEYYFTAVREGIRSYHGRGFHEARVVLHLSPTIRDSPSPQSPPNLPKNFLIRPLWPPPPVLRKEKETKEQNGLSKPSKRFLRNPLGIGRVFERVKISFGF